MRCPNCQTQLPINANACACGEIVRVVPRATPPTPLQPTPPVAMKHVPAMSFKPSAHLALDAHGIEFEGDGSTLFFMHLYQLALTGLTLGVYHFWAKVKVREYLFSMTGFAGDRFAYHGLGKELLLGWLKVAGIFGTVLGIGLFLEFGLKIDGGMIVGQGLVYLVGLALLPIALVGSQRYRLSRTSWRGIRFSFRGPTLQFCRLWVVGWLAQAFTLGLYSPFFQSNARGFITDHTYFGTQRFNYDGNGKELFNVFIVAWFLTIPTLGIYWFKYKAQRDRYFWSHTTFADARFESTVTGRGLLKVACINLIVWIFTAGMGKPWMQVTSLQYMLKNLRLVGPLDVDRIEQEAQLPGAGGEGLTDFVEASFFDVELGL
jgi:uncharacterized membrane protein YjgN (DUF898 family)